MADYALSATLSLKDKFTGTIRNFKKDMKEVNSSSERTSKKMRGLTGSARGLYATMGGIGAIAGIKKSVEMFASLEVQNVKNRNIIGATREEYKKLEDQQKDLQKTSIYSSQQVAKAQEFMGRAGWDVNKIFSATPDILNLVTASGEDLAQVSDIVTDGMTAMGYSSDQTESFVDSLLKTSNKTNTSILQLGESFNYVAPIANSLGEPMEDLNTLIGVLANNGIKGSRAGTTLRQAYQKLIKPTTEGAKVLDNLNIKTVDSQGNFRGLIDITNELRGKTDKMTDAQRASVVSTVFGVIASTGMTKILTTQKEEIVKLNKEIKNNKGATKNMAKEMEDTTDGSIKKMKNSVGQTATSLGEMISPSVITGMGKLTDLFNKMSDGSDDAKKNIEEIKTALTIGGATLLGAKIGGAPGAALGAGISAGAITGKKVVEATSKVNEAKAGLEITETRRGMATAEAGYKQKYGESSTVIIQNLKIDSVADFDGFVKRTKELANTQ